MTVPGSPTLDAPAAPAAAADIFGDRLDRAAAFAHLLATEAVPRGLLGPREVPALWARHLLNSAALRTLVPAGATVVDLGSGAGLPGIPLALARPDLRVLLVEPMARRARFLDEVREALDLAVEVVHARAEDLAPESADVVVARAVAPLERLAPMALPVLRRGGRLLALKGRTAAAEVKRAAVEVRRAGGAPAELISVGAGDERATVVAIERVGPRPGAGREARAPQARGQSARGQRGAAK